MNAHLFDTVRTNLVGQMTKNNTVLKSILELILFVRILFSHNFLHPFSSNLNINSLDSENTIQ